MGKHPGGSDQRLGWATLAAAVILSGCASGTGASLPPRTEGRLRVAGLNVHYLAPRGGAVTQWPPREAAVVATLSAIDADVIAFQEMETFAGGAFNRDNLQQESLAAAFPAFGFTATGDPEVFPNTQPIMFRRARFTPREQGYVFFSPTSDELYSRPWFGHYPSFGTWARLWDRTDGARYLFVNVHIDRSRYRNQLRSAKLVAKIVTQVRRTDDRVIVLGDFNAFRWMAPVRIVARNAGLTVLRGNGATFHFYRGLHLVPAIDHILVGPPLCAADTWTLRTRPGGVWPSDHYPVVADLFEGPAAR